MHAVSDNVRIPFDCQTSCPQTVPNDNAYYNIGSDVYLSNGQIIKNTQKIIIDETTDWYLVSSSNGIFAPAINTINTNSLIVCDQYPNIDVNYSGALTNPGFYIYDDGDYQSLTFRAPDYGWSGPPTTVEELKALLVEYPPITLIVGYYNDNIIPTYVAPFESRQRVFGGGIEEFIDNHTEGIAVPASTLTKYHYRAYDELSDRIKKITPNITELSPYVTAVNLSNLKANDIVKCGTLTSLTLSNLPTSGIVDIRFTSGTTPTVLTVPNTVKWANGFDPTSLNANTTYELNIIDGVWGVAAVWET